MQEYLEKSRASTRWPKVEMKDSTYPLRGCERSLEAFSMHTLLICFVNQSLFMVLTINGIPAALKKGSLIELCMDKFGNVLAIKANYIAFSFCKLSENRIFTDADDYSMEIELPLADCPQNLDIFGMITRKDVDAGDIFFDAVLQDTNFINSASRMQSQVFLSIAFLDKI